jgi:hypothetical protein
MEVVKDGDIGRATCWLPPEYIGSTVYVYPCLHHDMEAVVELTNEQIIEFMRVGLRHAEYSNSGPTVNEIREGLRAALATHPTERK